MYGIDNSLFQVCENLYPDSHILEKILYIIGIIIFTQILCWVFHKWHKENSIYPLFESLHPDLHV